MDSFELILRPNAPLWIKFVYLTLVVSLSLYIGFRRGWFMLLLDMASAPFSRYKWKIDNLNISADIIIISILSYSFITGLLFESLLPGISNSLSIIPSLNNLLGLVTTIVLLLTIKIVLVILFFVAHKQKEEGLQLMNFHLGFNQILIFIASIWLGIVIFYFNFSQFGLTIILWIYGAFWAVRLYGTILFLLMKFQYSVVTIFTYLCAFEIMPYIVVARIIFMNN